MKVKYTVLKKKFGDITKGAGAPMMVSLPGLGQRHSLAHYPKVTLSPFIQKYFFPRSFFFFLGDWKHKAKCSAFWRYIDSTGYLTVVSYLKGLKKITYSPLLASVTFKYKMWNILKKEKKSH